MDDPQQPAPPPPPQEQPVPLQRRLQELRAIPERDRTDAQWDELNEVEIALASANRPGAPDPNIRHENRHGGGQNHRRDAGGQGGKPGQNPNHRHRQQNRDRQRQRGRR